MLKFGSISNGAKPFNFIHNFRNLLLYSTSVSTDQHKPELANYLVKTLGFSKRQALLTSSKFVLYRMRRGVTKVSGFDFIENANSVISYFKQIGLQHSHIQTAIVAQPVILRCRVNTTLIPKIQVLQNLGFSGPDLAEVMRVNPLIFIFGSGSVIVPAIRALREILGSESNVITLLKRSRRVRLSCFPKLLVPNVALLQSYDVPIESIRKFLLRTPYPFLRKTEFFKVALIKVEETLGIPRNSPQFLHGVVLLNCATEKTIDLKLRVFKSFGWTDSDIFKIATSSPFLLALSEARIKKKLDFLMNEMGYESSFMAKNCYLLTCSLEKRIVPRHKVLLFLKENGLIKTDQSLSSVVRLTEAEFLKRFVLPFKEVHQVYSKLLGVSLKKMLTVGLLKPNSDAA